MIDRYAALYEYLDSCKDKQFEFGQFDCLLFAQGWDVALNGSSKLESIASVYSNEKTAIRELRKIPLLNRVESVLGSRKQDLAIARGDIAIVDVASPLGPSLGICDGAVVWVPCNVGLTNIKLDKILGYWRL